MAQDADLGQLIMRLNPYTNNRQYGGQPTGEMDVYTINPTPTPGGPTVSGVTGTIPQIQIEVDTSYPGDWTFKGQPQKVNKAARILYRFPVMSGPPSTSSPPTVLYWIEDYLLIGFEGSGAG